MQSGSSSNTAKHSRACENCSRAKAKCVPQPDGQSDRCTRCFRLKKECVIPPRAVRKKRSPNTASNSAQLEQKIESLVTLLSAAQGSVSVGRLDDLPEPPQERPHANLLREFPWGNSFSAQNKESPGHLDAASSGKSTHAPSPEEDTVLDLVKKHWPEDLSGNTTSLNGNFPSEPDPQTNSPENLLRIFRDRFAIHSPYVILPADITVDELRAKQPWLYKIIMVVASSHERSQQLELGKQFATDIAVAMITRGEKTLDMLQSLLVHNTWSYYFSAVSPQSQSSAMTQLQLALLFDLALNRAVRDDEGGPGGMLEDASKKAWNTECVPREKRRTLSERRALLYSYFVASVTSLCIKKIDGVQTSPYIEYSCQILREAAEHENDLILVACVRLQYIVESINRHLANRPPTSDGPKAPYWMHATSVRAELQNILISLPPNLQSHPLFRMSYHSAEIFLYEPSVHGSSFPSYTSQRIDMLYACLLSARSLLDVFMAHPLSAYCGFSITNLAQIGHACSTLFKLSLVEEVGWDLVHVRQTVNLTAYFDQLVSNFEQAGAAIDSSQRVPSKESFPTGCARAMGRVKGWYEAKVASESESEGHQRHTSFTGIDDMLNGNGFDYLDGSYWQEIMADMTFMQQ